jgi:hypothetical protein
MEQDETKTTSIDGRDAQGNQVYTLDMIDTMFADSLSRGMQNAIISQQNAQMASSASIINACARILQAKSDVPSMEEQHKNLTVKEQQNEISVKEQPEKTQEKKAVDENQTEVEKTASPHHNLMEQVKLSWIGWVVIFVSLAFIAQYFFIHSSVMSLAVEKQGLANVKVKSSDRTVVAEQENKQEKEDE